MTGIIFKIRKLCVLRYRELGMNKPFIRCSITKLQFNIDQHRLTTLNTLILIKENKKWMIQWKMNEGERNISNFCRNEFSDCCFFAAVKTVICSHLPTNNKTIRIFLCEKGTCCVTWDITALAVLYTCTAAIGSMWNNFSQFYVGFKKIYRCVCKKNVD